MKSKIYGYYGGYPLYGLQPRGWREYYSIYTSSRVDKYKVYPDERKLETKFFGGIRSESIELCTYLTYLINGNILEVESLFVPIERVDFVSDLFKSLVLENKSLFIDRGQLIDNVVQNAERIKKESLMEVETEITTFLASKPELKKAESIIKARDGFRAIGYSSVYYLELIRILASTLYFLKTDEYPLASLATADKQAFKLCTELAEARENWTAPKGDLDLIIDGYVAEIEKFSLDGDEEKFRFDSGYALSVLKEFDKLSKNR